MDLEVPEDYPSSVHATLEALGDALTAADCTRHLAALVVYGSVARREARPGSDLNLAVVLHATDATDAAAALAAMREPFRSAFREARVDPFLVTADEIPRLSDVFPAKLLDIQAHHDCIFGVDPFASLEIDWRDLRFRVEQSLRNQLLRMRRFYLFRGDDAQQLHAQLDRAIAALHVELEGLLRLASRDVPLRLPAVFEQAGMLLDVERSVIQRLVAHRRGGEASRVEHERDAFLDVMAVLGRAVEHVDRLEPPR